MKKAVITQTHYQEVWVEFPVGHPCNPSSVWDMKTCYGSDGPGEPVYEIAEKPFGKERIQTRPACKALDRVGPILIWPEGESLIDCIRREYRKLYRIVMRERGSVP